MTSPHRRGRRARVILASFAAGLALLSTGVAPAAALEENGVLVGEMTPELRDRIQARLERFRAENTISGLSMAVVTPQQGSAEPVVTQFSLGYMTIDQVTPVVPTTQFELGSETKAFTADLLALLLAEGRISLDDTVAQYTKGSGVWEWPATATSPAVPITIGQLATHQSGLPDIPGNFYAPCSPPTGCPNDNPRPLYTQQDIWDSVDPDVTLQQPLLWQPGTRWLYSNWGFALLGVILANIVHDVPIGDVPRYQPALEGAFLRDLGMAATALEWPDEEVAQPYTRPEPPTYPQGRPTARWNNVNAFAGGGGLISNAVDMSRWVAAHLGYRTAGAPLGIRSLATTLEQVGTVQEECNPAPTPQDPGAIACGAPRFQQGLAWQLFPRGWAGVGVPHAWKNGGTFGSASDTALAPSVGVGVTAMFDQNSNGSTSIATQVLAEIVPLERPRPVLPATGADAAGLATTALAAAGAIAAGVLLLRRRRTGRP